MAHLDLTFIVIPFTDTTSSQVLNPKAEDTYIFLYHSCSAEHKPERFSISGTS